MKKHFLIILAISVLCAIISFILCLTSVFTYESKYRTEKVLDEIQAEDEIDDAEGYGYILEGTVSVLADTGEAIAVIIMLILIPGVCILLIVLAQIISGVMQIGKHKPWKVMTAKVCNYISMGMEFIFTLYIGLNIFSNLSVNKIILMIAFILNLVCSVGFIIEVRNIRKTQVYK